MKYLYALVAIGSAVFADDCSLPEKPYPKTENCRCENVYEIAEFLYWRFSSPTLAYGQSGVGSLAKPVTSGATFLPDYDYNPGFKVGSGIKFGPAKAFDLCGYYAWLYSHPHGHVSGSPISTTFLPLNWTAASALNTYTYASLDLHLHLNYYEVQSGYTFNVNNHFALRPYFSLAGYVIDSDLRAKYEFTTPGPSLLTITKTHGKCSSWSIGPKAGLDFIYRLTAHWGIYSNVAISQQITHIDMKTEETEEIPAAGVNFTIQKGHLVENRNIAFFSLEIGPTWDQWFCDAKYHVYLRATYGANNLNTAANLSFLNNNNVDANVQSEYRGLNARALLEF